MAVVDGAPLTRASVLAGQIINAVSFLPARRHIPILSAGTSLGLLIVRSGFLGTAQVLLVTNAVPNFSGGQKLEHFTAGGIERGIYLTFVSFCSSFVGLDC